MKNLLLFAVLVTLPLLLGGCGEKEWKVEDTAGHGSGIDAITYDNGQMEFKIRWKDGKHHGLTERWYRNGVRKSEEYWNEGELFVAKYWDKKGKPIDKSGIRLNLKDPLIKQTLNIDGVNSNAVEVRDDGKLFLKGSDTPYTGRLLKFHENGQKRSESYWEKGLLLEGHGNYWNNKGDSVDFLGHPIEE